MGILRCFEKFALQYAQRSRLQFRFGTLPEFVEISRFGYCLSQFFRLNPGGEPELDCFHAVSAFPLNLIPVLINELGFRHHEAGLTERRGQLQRTIRRQIIFILPAAAVIPCYDYPEPPSYGFA